ncbi:hypothetical protein GCK32_004310 [Trichostrongylus colubriformis]|uniref:Uncharacterized protein n=1 Tax=Trichostrongylus colubriformis TaxID=6319 RepID=A0AAN8FEP1_TRICO
MLFSLGNSDNYVILALHLPVMASLVALCRRLRGHDDEVGIVLTKNAPCDGEHSKSRPTSNPRPPPNMPIAPPSKDPLDDTLRGVKSLKIELSGKAKKKKQKNK